MWHLETIGVVQSCFTDKFGIPRQPGIVSESRATIELIPPYDDPAAVMGLEACSHIWIEFIFHQNTVCEWKPKVKPPRLGGNKTMGVFATRSPTRPNRLGLSVVSLDQIDIQTGRRESRVHLHISGHDLLNGTPIVDIKPYVPYADSVTSATNSFAIAAPNPIAVVFSDQALQVCIGDAGIRVNLEKLVTQVLGQNPRPAYKKHDPNRYYGTQLYSWEIKWRYRMDESDGRESIYVESIMSI